MSVDSLDSSSELTSAERYRSLVVATGQIVWTNSPNGEMLGEQPGWGGFTGQSYGEYQRFGWADAVHPDDRQPTIDAWNESVRTKSVFNFEHRVRRHDGEYRLFSIRAVPVLNDDGSIREWVGIHSDVTARRESENALRQSEERYRILAASLPVLVWTARTDGSFEYVNPAFIALSGLKEEELLRDGWKRLLHPSDVPQTNAAWEEAVRTRSPFDAEARVLNGADGLYRWHRLRGVPTESSYEVGPKWIGSATDIDDQKRITEVREAALAQVRTERARLKQIFMNAPAVMAIYHGPEHVIEMVNPAWEKFSQRSARDAEGRKVRDVFPELEGQGVFELLDMVWQSGKSFSDDNFAAKLERNGRLEDTNWRVVFQPLLGSDGRATDIVVHAVEITSAENAGSNVD